ncbi:MAG TPA: hypothetical protein VNL92_05515 [Dehalococcoidia bacterium]|nr:hypothetical protein [Dehalococcoidia bacterium]
MTWSLYRWTWQLESPLYVGMPPAGSLNRCRLYVPARALWGAVTAELARAKGASTPADYKRVGEQVSEHVRFTYLYPAEATGKDWRAWLPKYERGEGLVWEREDRVGDPRSDRAFRTRLLSSRPGTAIDPGTETAADGSLRETECINEQWRDTDGRAGSRVALVGYLFICTANGAAASPIAASELEGLDTLFIGGDTRYGLGKLSRAFPGGWEEATSVFGAAVDVAGPHPRIRSGRVLAHARPPRTGGREVFGQLELVAGWDDRNLVPQDTGPLLAPGSSSGEELWWRLEPSGFWNPASIA